MPVALTLLRDMDMIAAVLLRLHRASSAKLTITADCRNIKTSTRVRGISRDRRDRRERHRRSIVVKDISSSRVVGRRNVRLRGLPIGTLLVQMRRDEDGPFLEFVDHKMLCIVSTGCGSEFPV